jgi:hypothetical protein
MSDKIKNDHALSLLEFLATIHNDSLKKEKVTSIYNTLEVRKIAEEAMDKYEEAHKEACKKQIEEMSKPRLLVPEGSVPAKQAQGKIITGDVKR